MANMKKLVDDVDRLGRLRKRKTDIEGAERELSGSVRAAMELRKIAQVEGRTWVAQFDDRPRLQIDARKFRRFCIRKATEKAFLECITVNVKAARARFPDNGMAGLGKMINSTVLRVSKRPATGKRK